MRTRTGVPRIVAGSYLHSLTADTTTSLANLGYDVSFESFIEALIPFIEDTLSS